MRPETTMPCVAPAAKGAGITEGEKVARGWVLKKVWMSGIWPVLETLMSYEVGSVTPLVAGDVQERSMRPDPGPVRAVTSVMKTMPRKLTVRSRLDGFVWARDSFARASRQSAARAVAARRRQALLAIAVLSHSLTRLPSVG